MAAQTIKSTYSLDVESVNALEALAQGQVTRDDPMVQTLLRHKADHYTDYDLESFERCLAGMFRVLERQPLASGTRISYYGQPKI